VTEELPWLTLTEAAERTGLNRETIRSRARRGLIPYRRGNNGGMLVQVATGSDRDVTAPDRGLTEALTDLQDEIADLRERLARSEADAAAARAIAASQVEAKDQIIAELKMMLTDARRPWWQRLLGR
jgi:hypothetical protein